MSGRRDWFDRLTTDPWLTLRVDAADVRPAYDVHEYARVDAWLLDEGLPVARGLLATPFASLPGSHVVDALGPQAASARLRLRLGDQRTALQSDVVPATVVVHATGKPQPLSRCLRSLSRLSPGVREIVVLATGEHADELERVAADASVRCRRTPADGIPAALDAVAADADGGLVLLAAGDTEVEPSWAAFLAAALDDPLVVVATGVVLRPIVSSPADQLCEVLALPRRDAAPRTYDGTAVHPFQASRLGSAASMAVRAEELRALGGLPPIGVGSAAETVLVHAALLAGYQVAHVPAAVSWRHGPASGAVPEAVLREHACAAGAALLEAVRRERRAGSAAVGARELLGKPLRRAAARALQREGAPSWSLVRAELGGLAAAPAVARAAGRHATRPGADAARDHAWLGRLLASRPAAPATTHERPPLSVVVPTRGRREKVVRLVRRLQAQQYPEDRLEIVIAVDGDVDGTAQALDQLDVPRRPRVVVLTSPGNDPHHGSGAGTARNAGAGAAAGEVLLFLDDDVQPVDDQLLVAHAAGREQHPHALLVGLCPPRMADQRSYLAQTARAWWVQQTRALLAGQPLRFTDVTTANLSVSRRDFLEHGGFMDIPRREDWELGLRFSMAGREPIALPAAAVEHLFDTELSGFLADVRREGSGDALMVARHPGALGMLPLEAWRSATPRRKRLLAAAVEGRAAPRLLPVAGPASLVALERAGLRGRWQRALGLLLAAAYWNGVGDAFGSVRRLEEVLAESEHLARQGCGSYDAMTGDLRLPDARAASEVDVLVGDRQIGRVPLRWGGVPFRREALVARVLDVYAAQVLAARGLSGEGPTAPPEPSVRVTT